MKAYNDLVRHPGNQGLFRVIEMAVLSILNGQPIHFHAEGLRGTGKTTIIRGAKTVLPRIQRIRGCIYNCDPKAPQCPEHRDLDPEEILQLGAEWVDMPFAEISHSAKIGTIAGSIDLARITDRRSPEAALLAGSIPRANRGILFVDEINRLADTAPDIADILLDVMGTKPGRIQIEEAGLPTVSLPVKVSVWAASNPDEDPGPLQEIRRQLADRFDFAVDMQRPRKAIVVRSILDQMEGLISSPTRHELEWEVARMGVGGFSPVEGSHGDLNSSQQTSSEAGRLSDLLRVRAEGFPSVEVPEKVKSLISDLYVNYDIESIRAAEGLYLGVKTAALLDGRHRASVGDLLEVAPLALQHRVPYRAFTDILAYLRGINTESREGTGVSGPGGVEETKPVVSGADSQSQHAPATGLLEGASGQEHQGADSADEDGSGSDGHREAPGLPGEPERQERPGGFSWGDLFHKARGSLFPDPRGGRQSAQSPTGGALQSSAAGSSLGNSKAGLQGARGGAGLGENAGSAAQSQARYSGGSGRAPVQVSGCDEAVRAPSSPARRLVDLSRDSILTPGAPRGT